MGAAAGTTGDSAAAVGACDSEPTGAPHEGQNRWEDINSPPQDGQSIVWFLVPDSQAFNAINLCSNLHSRLSESQEIEGAFYL